MTFIDDFIQGHMAGQKERQSEEEQEARKEEREWRRKIQKIEIQREELKDKLAERLGQRGEAMQNASLQEGTPGTIPQPANPGNAAFGLPGGPPPVPPSLTHAPITIPSAYGGPDTSITPHSADQVKQSVQEAMQQRIAEKLATEKPTIVGKDAEGFIAPGASTMTSIPQAAKQASNAVELYQKDPAAWEKMISTQAKIDHVLNPEKMTDAKFQYQLYKDDPKTWETLFGTSKAKDPGAELLTIMGLAKSPITGDIDQEVAGKIKSYIDNARSGKPVGFTVPTAPAPPPAPGGGGLGGLLGGLLPGGSTPDAPAPPPSVMPAPKASVSPPTGWTPEQLKAKGYVKVKGGWHKAN